MKIAPMTSSIVLIGFLCVSQMAQAADAGDQASSFNITKDWRYNAPFKQELPQFNFGINEQRDLLKFFVIPPFQINQVLRAQKADNGESASLLISNPFALAKQGTFAEYIRLHVKQQKEEQRSHMVSSMLHLGADIHDRMAYSAYYQSAIGHAIKLGLVDVVQVMLTVAQPELDAKLNRIMDYASNIVDRQRATKSQKIAALALFNYYKEKQNR
jgi:hypothetical protein